MSVTKRLIEAPVVISLGADLGDRKATLLAAVRELAETERVEVTAISSVIETPVTTTAAAVRADAVDLDATASLNAVVLLTTTLTPGELLTVLNGIEKAPGRTLHLDIVDFAGISSSSERLTLPHPHAFEREYVLKPWLEVDPDAELPGHGSVAALVAGLGDGPGTAVGAGREGPR